MSAPEEIVVDWYQTPTWGIACLPDHVRPGRVRYVREDRAGGGLQLLKALQELVALYEADEGS